MNLKTTESYQCSLETSHTESVEHNISFQPRLIPIYINTDP